MKIALCFLMLVVLTAAALRAAATDETMVGLLLAHLGPKHLDKK